MVMLSLETDMKKIYKYKITAQVLLGYGKL